MPLVGMDECLCLNTQCRLVLASLTPVVDLCTKLGGFLAVSVSSRLEQLQLLSIAAVVACFLTLQSSLTTSILFVVVHDCPFFGFRLWLLWCVALTPRLHLRDPRVAFSLRLLTLSIYPLPKTTNAPSCQTPNNICYTGLLGNLGTRYFKPCYPIPKFGDFMYTQVLLFNLFSRIKQ